MKDVNVAIVGAGYWGPNLIRNFNKLARAKVVTVCDTDKKRLDLIKQSYPFINVTQNFSDVLNQDISLVAIATPMNTHFTLAQQALLSGKHVMIEKPLTKTVTEAKKLIALAKKKDRLLFSGHTFVYNPAVQKMKQLIKNRRLGKVYYYESMRANLGLIQNDANVLWDLAPHDFSILRYIFPYSPLAIRVIASRFVHKVQEEVAHVFIKFEQNTMAHMYLSWLSPLKMRTIMIAGAKKMLVYDELNPGEKIRIYNKGVDVTKTRSNSFQSRYRYGDIIIPTIDETEALERELGHFVSCILTKKTPLTGGKEGLEVVTMLEAAERSYKTGKEILLTSYNK